MPLPRESDNYQLFTGQLVYFAGRLDADKHMTDLAPDVDAMIAEVDRDYLALRDIKRTEFRRRAKRDHQDNLGDDKIKDFRDNLRMVPHDHFATTTIFPKGTAHAIAPRGRPQIERLNDVAKNSARVLASPQLAADPKVNILNPLIEDGKNTATDMANALDPLVTDWEAILVDLAKAADQYDFIRADIVERLGETMGEIRKRCKGDNRAAYRYTQQSRGNRGKNNDDKKK